jgi:hypothetical protein
MRRVRIGMLLGAAMLAACSNSASNLSKEEEQVLDAMMFLFTGIEDNTKDDVGLTPWRREVGSSRHVALRSLTVAFGVKRLRGERTRCGHRKTDAADPFEASASET